MKAIPRLLSRRTGVVAVAANSMMTMSYALAARIAEKSVVQTYVYFMHEDEALGTRFAQRLNELWAERPTVAPTA
jgi:hypothetical protein